MHFLLYTEYGDRPSLNGERVEGEEGEVLLEGVAVVGDVQ